ncbi:MULTISPECIES: glycosyltransferase family 4 protein [Pseudomonas]|uniref:Glycosyltransferase n=1 Tax=Pseudomonas rhodesiae TaxID=76760 RepID=A0A8I1JGR7_9PSED|nr:glycosyltransferase [Pseudomonas rhodesiae]MBI6605757.1 glycosyltransferase [Pseudomonas sp. S4_EA_1b]MBI6627962.1 glycosyltransferase [Pseudomonas rhodesiae]NMY80848.1 glycosyltransferase [Pseudomonas rhodesiae]NMZ15982.1 glycosyltransferase [Pseudomonas rhodesiae]
MKVTHVIVGLNIGGAELMLRRLCESLNFSSEDEHRVISLTDLGEVGALLRAHGVTVDTLGMRGAWDVFRAFNKLVRLLQSSKPDVVQTWMYHADLLGGLAARRVGVKAVIWGIRTTDVSKGGGRATIIIRKLCAWLSSSVPSVIVCAAQASRASHVAVGYSPGKMTVIPNGFDLERMVAQPQDRESIRSTQGIGEDDLVIGSLGRYNQVKDHSSFVKAAGLVAARFAHVKFLMVGRDVDHANSALMAEIAATGYPDRFVLLGERRDVPACFKAMDIFCLHSLTEGFPNVLGEAMSMALPCVTTDAGDAAFLLGENGFVVPIQDPLALAEALAKIAGATFAERTAMGQGSYKRIVENFTMKCTEHKFKAIYDRLYLNQDVH